MGQFRKDAIVTYVKALQHHLYGASEGNQGKYRTNRSPTPNRNTRQSESDVQLSAMTSRRSVYSYESNGHDERCNIDMTFFICFLFLIHSLSTDEITDVHILLFTINSLQQISKIWYILYWNMQSSCLKSHLQRSSKFYIEWIYIC
jgi:hypothetical protein